MGGGRVYNGAQLMTSRTFSLSALGLAAAAVLASCSPEPYRVHFLTEADPVTSGTHFSIPHEGKLYNRTPIMSLNQFEKFSSFMDMQDGSYGVRLYTKPEYKLRLANVTLENRGRYMLPIVNGLAFQPMKIDAVYDGQLVIWSGLNGWDLMKLGENLEPVNPEVEKKRYKKKNPRPLPPKPKKS